MQEHVGLREQKHTPCINQYNPTNYAVLLSYRSLDGCVGEGVERGDTGFRVSGLVRETVEDSIGEENGWKGREGERERERERKVVQYNTTILLDCFML